MYNNSGGTFRAARLSFPMVIFDDSKSGKFGGLEVLKQ